MDSSLNVYPERQNAVKPFGIPSFSHAASAFMGQPRITSGHWTWICSPSIEKDCVADASSTAAAASVALVVVFMFFNFRF
jgi:hypothetical protein